MPPSPSPTLRLASWCAEAPDRWPDAAREAVRRAFVDTLATLLAGRQEPCAATAREAVSRWGSGPCFTAGGGRLPAPWAALVNGTAAHALDYDDVLDPALNHPSAGLVPALLALAEQTGASAAACVDAYIIGFEVMARLGEAMNQVHYQRGWHTTLSLGSPAVAAACARLLRLDARQTGMAISLATSMAGGSKRQFGSMAKPLHAGLAAKNGLLAAQLAASGLEGIEEPLDGRWGYQEMMAGETAPGLGPAFAKLGGAPAVLEHGIWAKFYPCCASTHRPVDALLSLRLAAADVERIEGSVSEIAAANLRYRIPAGVAEARFSLPYCLAAALFDGPLTPASFTPAAIARPPVLDLVDRTEMRLDPDQPASRAIGDAVETGGVRVFLRDGTVREASVVTPHGHPRDPLTTAELEGKFRACAAAGGLPAAATEAALAQLANFAGLASLGGLTGLLEQG
jgi:2-methylcitrate dehydratase PrpD